MPAPLERSRLGRLNPLSKLALAGAFLAASSLVFEPRFQLAAILAALLPLILLEGARPLGLLWRLWPFALVGLGYLWLNLAFFDRAAAYTWTSAAVPVAQNPALFAGTTLFLRAIALGAISLFFVRTTDPADFLRSLMLRCRLPAALGLRPSRRLPIPARPCRAAPPAAAGAGSAAKRAAAGLGEAAGGLSRAGDPSAGGFHKAGRPGGHRHGSPRAAPSPHPQQPAPLALQQGGWAVPGGRAGAARPPWIFCWASRFPVSAGNYRHSPIRTAGADFRRSPAATVATTPCPIDADLINVTAKTVFSQDRIDVSGVLQPLRCRQAMSRSAASAISAVEPA